MTWQPDPITSLPGDLARFLDEALVPYETDEVTRLILDTHRDSERNCLSNIHSSGGLSDTDAADKLAWLMMQAGSGG